MSEFHFGDFTEQETRKLFENENQGVTFPWTGGDCLNTTIEFGFDVPRLESSSAIASVSYPNHNSLNSIRSQQESTSSSSEHVTGNKSSARDSNKKSKKKRPVNYYNQEYRHIVEATSTSQHHPFFHHKNTEHQTNINDSRYISCDQWVNSTIQHQQEHDEQLGEDPTTNNDGESEVDLVQTTSTVTDASVEVVKTDENHATSTTSDTKPKFSSWAALFQSQQTNKATGLTQSSISDSKTVASKPNYQVHDSSSEYSKSLEEYFSQSKLRTSAMAIKPRGLINRSNYCYINATLQTLLACPAFFNVMKHIPLNANNESTQRRMPCTRAFYHFVNEFDKMDRNKSNTTNHKDISCGSPFNASEILEVVGRLRKLPIEIVQSKQEDAHELLCQLLSEIHEEICQVVSPNASTKTDNSEEMLDTTAQDVPANVEDEAEDWFQVGKRHRSHVFRTNEIKRTLISDIFAGRLQSIIHSSGNQRLIVNEPFFTLSLDVKDTKITNIDEAIQSFCQSSNVSDYVDSKNRSNSTSKSMLFDHLPPILIIHFKSFIYDAKHGLKKLSRTINYSVDFVWPRDTLTKSAQKQGHEHYKLFAVEYHQGDEANKGHYLSDVFHPGLQGWLRHDDTRITVVSSHQVLNPSLDKLTPYLLFYRRGD